MYLWDEVLKDLWAPLLKLDKGFKTDCFSEGNALCLELLSRALTSLEAQDWNVCRKAALEALEISYERLHSGPTWRDVSVATRTCYAKSQLILSACEARGNRLDECLRRLDMLLLMGPGGLHTSINRLVDAVQSFMDEQEAAVKDGQLAPSPPASEPPPETQPLGQSPQANRDAAAAPSPSRKRPRLEESIPRVSAPALLSFFDTYVRPRHPVILTDCMGDWPAMGQRTEFQGRAWSDLEYLRRVAGRRTVPVEVGTGTYLSSEWGQRLMKLSTFIDDFIVTAGEGPGEKGYLAQHELLEQIPQLRRDILTPDYCALDDDDDEEEGGGDANVAVNAWFGPGGTVSPTHTDPFHNLLAQVVGTKHVRLWAPTESSSMYPCRGIMSNNSQVDPKCPDLSRFPHFPSARSVSCVLRAGEMLYIPPFFWHHIESTERSFSVSFWWGRRKQPPEPLASLLRTQEEEEKRHTEHNGTAGTLE